MVTKKKSETTENKAEKKVDNETVEINYGKFFSGLRANPWMASTIVLGIVVVLMLVFGSGGSAGTTATITADEAGEKVLGFLNSNPSITGEVTLVSAEQDGQFYEVMLSYQGQEVPVYTTLDGEFLVGNPVALDEAAAEDTAGDSGDTPAAQPSPDTSVPKTDRPVVELFVMSHCPFGTQMMKGMIPVVELLGDEIDFELKYVSYAMHGEKEVMEQARQYCIQEEQNEKFLPYLRCFLEADDSEGCLASTGVDTGMMDACVERIDEEFAITENLEDQSKWLNGRFPQFNTHKAENEEYGVRGSPTLVINGQQASSGRDAASLLGTVCAAFNEAPEECNTDLSGEGSPSPGFGWEPLSGGNGGAAAAAQCG